MQNQEIFLSHTQEDKSGFQTESDDRINVAPKNIVSSQPSLEKVLHNIFPQNSDESNILRVRRILGQTAEIFSDEQIQYIVAEFQFLIDSWLDEFEKEIFKGLTLKQVINEK